MADEAHASTMRGGGSTCPPLLWSHPGEQPFSCGADSGGGMRRRADTPHDVAQAAQSHRHDGEATRAATGGDEE
eukprot:1940501-Pyramimonas_sp.AAC.2